MPASHWLGWLSSQVLLGLQPHMSHLREYRGWSSGPCACAAITSVTEPLYLQSAFLYRMRQPVLLARFGPGPTRPSAVSYDLILSFFFLSENVFLLHIFIIVCVSVSFLCMHVCVRVCVCSRTRARTRACILVHYHVNEEVRGQRQLAEVGSLYSRDGRHWQQVPSPTESFAIH